MLNYFLFLKVWFFCECKRMIKKNCIQIKLELKGGRNSSYNVTKKTEKYLNLYIYCYILSIYNKNNYIIYIIPIII